MIPMLGFMASFSNQAASLSEPLDLYLHGYISSRLMRLPSSSASSQNDSEPAGLPLTIAATHLDGLVLALTPNHHSYNYRSAILHGFALPVTAEDEKLWAMEQITNGVVSSRWDNSRIPPTKAEMVSTQILKVRIVDASAKARAGGPGEDRDDLKDMEMRERTWVGVVPTWMKYGAPVPSKDNIVKNVSYYLTLDLEM
jgi:nitroimidazol reductase NimA-like FMN-containing flavoprotein (pyridoxamine 5'-phosphate oxidase superfamily)